MEKSRNHQSSEKRKTEQQKPAVEEKMRHNNQSPEKQQTEREKPVNQKKKSLNSCKITEEEKEASKHQNKEQIAKSGEAKKHIKSQERQAIS